MKKQAPKEIGVFERYLTVWVVLCMVAGILIGKFLPEIPLFSGRFEYANVMAQYSADGTSFPIDDVQGGCFSC